MARKRPLALRILLWALAFLALVACNEVGGYICDRFGLPVPGTVIGLLIMLAVLAVLRRVPEGLNEVAVYLLSHLNLFYVPAGVGVLGYVALVARDFWPIVITLFVSTFLATIAGGLAFQFVARATDKREADK
ncbi:MAG: CidA/LrgA family protein [Parvibaculum sp.]|nr:CidA/LrgA family protein [Parvibaculum sp.]|tara:strand:+ start:1093 stop:1491 length:399 start_codon:yes stop_codon:yes gene_type:complete